jgi:hypothetical protein
MFCLHGHKIWSLTWSKKHKLQVSENKLLRNIFEPKRDKVSGQFWILYEELHELYMSPSIVTVSKSRRLQGGCYMTWRGEKETHREFLVGRPLENIQLERDWKIILKWILGKHCEGGRWMN